MSGFTVRSLLKHAEERLAATGTASPRLDARLLLAHALGMEAAALFARPDHKVEDPSPFLGLLARRERREPVSHILGRREFWSRDFIVGPAVLDPRPDSETLIAALLDSLPDRQADLRLLDLGTGSGCLLLALLTELPNATGIGLDISPDALAVARRNAARLGLEERSEFMTGDWNGTLPPGRFDIVISNPPYIPSGDIPGLEPEVREYEPLAALDGGADGLDAYRAIARRLPGLLKPDGLAALELGIGQAEAVAGILAGAGLPEIGIKDDLSGIGRCLLARRPVPRQAEP